MVSEKPSACPPWRFAIGRDQGGNSQGCPGTPLAYGDSPIKHSVRHSVGHTYLYLPCRIEGEDSRVETTFAKIAVISSI